MKINRGTVGVGTVGGAMLLALAGCDDAAITSKDVGRMPEIPGGPAYSRRMPPLLELLQYDNHRRDRAA